MLITTEGYCGVRMSADDISVIGKKYFQCALKTDEYRSESDNKVLNIGKKKSAQNNEAEEEELEEAEDNAETKKMCREISYDAF